MSEYKYNLSSCDESSNKLGICQVCGKYVTEVFIQIEERHYNFTHNNINYEGWTHHNCNTLFGHENCLKSKQR